MAVTNCYACGKELYHHPDDPDWVQQWDNALVIVLEGGYGMFVDTVPTHDEPDPSKGILGTGGEYKVVICHECAHALCAAVPWLDRLIEPLKSHSHAYWRRLPDGSCEDVDWTGHEGWDLPHEKP